MTVTVSPSTIAFFTAAGVFRKRSIEKAREAFDDALSDYMETDEVSTATPDELFGALMAIAEERKAAKQAAIIAAEEKRAAKEAAEKAKPITGGMN